MKLKIGIFFGGKSRERAWSFAAAKTLYLYLDKKLFDAVPIFLDTRMQMFLVNATALLKSHPADFLHPTNESQDSDEVAATPLSGKPLNPKLLPNLINIAWITANSEFDETPALQEKLGQLGIPFTGNHPDSHELVWDKALLKETLIQQGFTLPAYRLFSAGDCEKTDAQTQLNLIRSEIKFPCYLKNARGEAHGAITLLGEGSTPTELENAINRAFFREFLLPSEWLDRSAFEKETYIRLICDPAEGPGLPVKVSAPDTPVRICHSPTSLYDHIDQLIQKPLPPDSWIKMEPISNNDNIIIEHAPDGKNFSCFVIRQTNRDILTLVPQSINPKDEMYFYFNPEALHPSTLRIPEVPPQQIAEIQQLALKVFTNNSFGTLAEIEGTIDDQNRIFLSEVRNTARLTEGSPLFLLAAREGMSTVNFLTQLLRGTLCQRSIDFPDKPAFPFLSHYLEEQQKLLQKTPSKRERIAIFFGGASEDFLYAADSARFLSNHFEASEAFEPVLFWSKDPDPRGEIYPVSNTFLFHDDPASLEQAIREARISPISIHKRTADLAWLCFGESRNLYPWQKHFHSLGIPSLGPQALTLQFLSDKTRYLNILEQNGIPVAAPNVHSHLPVLAIPILAHTDDNLELLPPLRLSTKEINTNIRLHGKQKFIFEQDPEWSKQLEKEVYPTAEKAARIMTIRGYALIYAFIQLDMAGSSRIFVSEIKAPAPVYRDCALMRLALLEGKHPMEKLEALIASAKLPSRISVEQKTGSFAQKNYQLMETRQNHSEKADKQPQETTPAFSAVLKEHTLYFLRTLWSFLRSPAFLRNIAAIAVTLGILYFILVFSLRIFTHHGSSLQIQDFTGMPVDLAEESAKANNLSLVITDSIFLVDEKPGVILNQTPEAFSRIKKDRSVYVTINSFMPPPITLPGLVGSYDYDQYTRKLQRLGIKYRIIEKRFDQKLEANTILFFYCNGEEITDSKLREGVKVPKGSTLDFVITERKSDLVSMPDLRCKTYNQAAFVLGGTNLEIGQVFGEFSDYDNAYVYKQNPLPTENLMVPLGTKVDLYLSSTLPTGCDTSPAPADTLRNNN